MSETNKKPVVPNKTKSGKPIKMPDRPKVRIFKEGERAPRTR